MVSSNADFPLHLPSSKESGYTMLIRLDEAGVDKPGVSRSARLNAARERDRVSGTHDAVHK